MHNKLGSIGLAAIYPVLTRGIQKNGNQLAKAKIKTHNFWLKLRNILLSPTAKVLVY